MDVIVEQDSSETADPREELLYAVEEFCRKVETGRARSIQSYGRFKAVLEQLGRPRPASRL